MHWSLEIENCARDFKLLDNQELLDNQDASVKAQENLKIYFWANIHFVLGLLARDIANHPYTPNTSLTQALNPLSFKFPTVF